MLQRFSRETQALIYIVDDDASVCKAMKRLLKSAGLAAQAFHSAQDFLSVATPQISDCLLVDVQMPGMSGLELQRQLIKNGIRVPVIFITAFDEDHLRQEARAAGAAGYFRKPFDDQALLDAIIFSMGRTHD